MRSQSRLGFSRAAAVAAVGAAVLLACHDAPSEPLVPSAVGHYELIGCTYSDTSGVASLDTCSTGGSVHYNWGPGRIVLNADGSATYLLAERIAYSGRTYTVLFDTLAATGTWTTQPQELRVSWTATTAAIMPRPAFYRATPELLRDDLLSGRMISLWYRRIR